MANVQKQFEQFHATIRVDYDMAEELREKRDIVVNRIKEYIKEKGLPGIRILLQGSYKMKTGVKPIADMEYDIDIGLRFAIHEDDHSAAEVRSWVYDAVKDHTKRIEDKGPCIRVVYQTGFHLDLVTYAVWEQGGTEKYRVAHKKRGWVEADPPKLLEHIDSARAPYAHTTDSRTKSDQFRRAVRYLRRWDDVSIPKESKAKPCGLAFVLQCGTQLSPTTRVDGTSDDAAALESLARCSSQITGRIVENKPTPEHEDLFAALSGSQMDKLKSRFRKLAQKLSDAAAEPDTVKACELLRTEFGDDFPVPAPEETAKKTSAPAIVASSASA